MTFDRLVMLLVVVAVLGASYLYFRSYIKKIAAAYNAVLAEHKLGLIELIPLNPFSMELVDALVAAWRHSGFPKDERDYVLSRFNRCSRFQQLNLLAMAFNELGINPDLPGEFWRNVKNPFQAKLESQRHIDAVISTIKFQHGVCVTIPNEPMNIHSWIDGHGESTGNKNGRMTEEQWKRYEQFMESGDLKGAEELLSHHLKYSPDDWNALYVLGVNLRLQERFDESISLLERARELNPHDAHILLALGISKQLVDDLPGSVEMLQTAIQLNPILIEAYNSLGITLRRLGKFNEALDVYNKGIDKLVAQVVQEMEGNRSQYYRDEEVDGELTTYVLPQWSDALIARIKSNITYAIMLNNVGLCLEGLGRLEEAKQKYRDAISFTPANSVYPDPVDSLERLES